MSSAHFPPTQSLQAKSTNFPLTELKDKLDSLDNLKHKINQHTATLSYAKSQNGCFKVGGHNAYSGNSSNFIDTSPDLTKLLIGAIQDELAIMTAQHDAEVEKLAAIQKLWS